MKNNLLNKLTVGLMTIIAVVFMAIPTESNAQYCGMGGVGYWYQYGIINSVTVTDITEGEVIIERLNSGWDRWADVTRTGGPYDLNIGNSFELTVQWGCYYYGTVRAYLDKNQDQRWDIAKIGPDEEYIGRVYSPYYTYNIPAQPLFTSVIPFNVSDDAPEGPSQLRIIAHYSQSYNDPCVIYYTSYYGYGEAEDYAINFAAPVPETYPTAGNILFNNQRYDGTTRNFNGVPTQFRLPAVESKGPQPTGTLIEYWITGPLPSTEVVYRALDPNTGSQSIRYNTPTQTYIMQSATGSASVSTSEGTFKASKGGEYRVNVKLTKASGKSAQAAKIFTVANNYDMSVASIESPRTNRYPRFFKYLVNTNIDVTCKVQNTGLNPIKRFEVTAKIYNAKTNVLVGNQPKYVFDTENDPNLLPLQSGQKHEASFAAFSSYNTGEFYIQFEVTYTYDEEEYNNFLPRPDGEKHYFEVQHNDQLTAGEFESPISGQILKVNRPTTPKVVFLNNGISDASNINFHMVVKNEAGSEVYNEVSFLEDMPQGRYNEKLVTFPNIVIREPGTYTGSAWVDYPYDLVNDDDTTFVTFEVELGIQDTITVGDELVSDEIQIVSNGFRDAKEDKSGNVIENINFEFINISPNPASNYVILNVSEKGLEINLIDINGRLVFSDIMKTNSYQLMLTNIESGVYIVIVKNENTLQSKQITIVK